jgi:hypothetical protein
MLSIILVIAGIVLLIWRKQIAQSIFDIQRPSYKFLFGKFVDLEKSWFRKLYDWAVIFAAVLLFLGAYATYFGPISL